MDIIEFSGEHALLALKNILSRCNEGIVLSNAENKIIYVNPAFMKITGFNREDVVGELGSFFRSERHDEKFYAELWQSINRIGAWEGEMWVRRASGEVFLEWLSLSVIKDTAGNIVNYLSIFSDITKHQLNAEQIQFLTYYDPLTHLPNRVKAYDTLNNFIATAYINQNKIAVFYLDLDRFKNINASYGFLVGDQLLQEIGLRLKKDLKEGALLARLTGDEFIIITPIVKSTDETIHFAQTLIDKIQTSFTLEDIHFSITASIGISIYPTDGVNAEVLINNAEAAMFAAKKKGRNNYQFYTKNLNTAAVEYLTMETQLREALQQNKFTVFYQPQIKLPEQTICGVEALLRWYITPEQPIAPSKFIPIAEEAGLIVPLTEWVLHQACLDNVIWAQAGLPLISTAVNISMLHFRHPAFKKLIAKTLEATGHAADRFELELTEGLLMQDIDATIELLMSLKAMGLRFSVDDFGTGYSSLSYLKRLPIDYLKIDQSFVKELEINHGDQAIVSTIITLAKNLNLTVIAEGVENAQQLAFLNQKNCDIAQGYYFSKPVTAEEIQNMLKKQVAAKKN